MGGLKGSPEEDLFMEEENYKGIPNRKTTLVQIDLKGHCTYQEQQVEVEFV